jgi:hypothetical protein
MQPMGQQNAHWQVASHHDLDQNDYLEQREKVTQIIDF